MKRPPFLSDKDESRVLTAIRDAEASTTGEIRLCISASNTTDLQAQARRTFERLGMHQTRDRNGVLLYIAPESRALFVLGDSGIHDRCGDPFWKGIVERLTKAFADGTVVAGFEAAIREIGAALTRHYPRTEGDTNELPDSVATD